MEIIYGLDKIKERHQNAIAVLGFFDGFHLGHQALVEQAKTLASQTEPVPPILLYTFDRHPLKIVNPLKMPHLLSTLKEKIKLAEKFRIDFLLIGTFDLSLSRLEPSGFMREIVAGALHPKGVVIGYNYRYGKERQGDAASLVRDGSKLNLSVTVVQPVTVNGAVVSSSGIRRLLTDGQVEEAGGMLGRPYAMEGKVVRGAGRGKDLGFPTANLEIPEKKLIPKAGIYAGLMQLKEKRYPGLISIGNAPTFSPNKLALEAHLFDFKENLYDKSMKIEFVAWHREQKKFPSSQDLVLAMKEDAVWGRQFFQGTGQISR